MNAPSTFYTRLRHSPDIKTLTGKSDLAPHLPAFKTYNETQFTAVKLPGASTEVLVTPFNALTSGDSRYFDSESATSFAFDHITRKASESQSHVDDSPHSSLVKSLTSALHEHAAEHFPSYTLGVYPSQTESSQINIALVSSKYSPTNFWNGRWRSSYTLNVTSGSLSGDVKVDVHYYEDGNVRMLTDKTLDLKVASPDSGKDIVRQIALAEKKYQEDLNRAFGSLSEGAFKGLRRQLPVTRQKVEWEKIGGYRLGQDIGGGGRK